MGRIKRFLSSEDGKSIVQAIVMSRIDYCNSLLYGVAATNLSKLQPVQNAAVRLVCSLKSFSKSFINVSMYLVFTTYWGHKNKNYLPIRNNDNNNVYTNKICGMYKLYNKTVGI